MILEWVVGKILNKFIKLNDSEIILNRQSQLRYLQRRDDEFIGAIISVGKNLLHLGNYNNLFIFNFWEEVKLLKKYKDQFKIHFKNIPRTKNINLSLRPERLINSDVSYSLSNLLYESYY